MTNLDFVELLLKEGADPNAQDHTQKTPLMSTATLAPGAAKFLLAYHGRQYYHLTWSVVSGQC